MNDIDALIKSVREAGHDLWLAGPQSDAAIAELERAIGFVMPKSYREFLSRYGGFGIGGSFISGIVDGLPLSSDAGSLFGDTQRHRKEFGMPAHLLVVQADEDAPYCLDMSAARDGEFPVVCYELHSRHVSCIHAM